jgi:molybdopterin-binding protein
MRYGGLSALESVDLAIEGGGVLGVIGTSGAGKTTLLKILAGLETPTSGTMMYNREEVNRENVQKLRREATILFQTPLFLRGDVYMNLAYGLRLRNIPEEDIKKRIEEALDRVRLPGFETRNVSVLSGGEAQRVALARALVIDPKVILLDEPSSNLDPSNASIISDIILTEAERRIVVVATHDYEQVHRLARRVLHLEAGRVVGEGETVEILSGARYADNVFTGDAHMEEGVCLVDIGGGVSIAAAFKASGRVFVRISPEDIIVSKGFIETSARNEFQSRITAIEEAGRIIRLKVDAGRIFTVQITRRSLEEMKLNVGGVVYISFKASSVEMT